MVRPVVLTKGDLGMWRGTEGTQWGAGDTEGGTEGILGHRRDLGTQRGCRADVGMWRGHRRDVGTWRGTEGIWGCGGDTEGIWGDGGGHRGSEGMEGIWGHRGTQRGQQSRCGDVGGMWGGQRGSGDTEGDRRDTVGGWGHGGGHRRDLGT